MAENTKDRFKGVLIDKNEQSTRQKEGFINIYANNVHLTASIFDFSLTFGEITGEKQDGKNLVEQKARVILSKEMTKVLAELLAGNIKAYEEQFGEIKIPTPLKPTKEQQILASAARRKKP